MSPQKHAANIANSKLSTGPRTAEGKARSSRNAFVHGLASTTHKLPEAQREEFDRHCEAIIAELAPVGVIEHQLADCIAIDFFRLNRCKSLDNELFALGHWRSVVKQFSNAETFENQGPDFALLTLYEQRIQRSLTRNMAALEERQATRKELKSEPAPERASEAPRIPGRQPLTPGPVAEGDPTSVAEGDQAVGFVYSNAPEPAISTASEPSVPADPRDPAPIPPLATRNAA